MVARVATPPPVPRITAEPTLTPNKSGKRRPGTFLAGAGEDRIKMPSDEMLKGVVMLVNEEGSVCHVDAESGVIPKRPCGPTVGMCGATGEWSVITGDGGRIPVARAMSRFEQLQREVVEAAHAQRAAEGGAERTASLESLDRFMSLDDPLDDSLLEPLAAISSGDDGGDDPLPHDPKLRPADLEAFSKAAAGARRPASSPPLHALPDVALLAASALSCPSNPLAPCPGCTGEFEGEFDDVLAHFFDGIYEGSSADDDASHSSGASSRGCPSSPSSDSRPSSPRLEVDPRSRHALAARLAGQTPTA